MPFDAIPNTTIETNPNAEALELARKVAEILAVPERWCQDEFTSDGAYCLIGALRKAASVPDDQLLDTPAAYAVRRRMGELCGPYRSRNSMVFNDAPTTTHADIVALTRAVVASFE